MAKNRNRTRSLGSSQLFERAQRELAKGNAKTALKDAEACFRQDARQEHRLLLERVYVGRVEQLQRQRLTAEARAVLRKLIDLKPADPEILNCIPRLQVVVGDCKGDAATVLEREPGLLVSLADQAVLDPRSPAPHHREVAAHVEHIREAFAAVERGDDNAAAKALHSVPHSSPLGDWKLFVRGLSLFYLNEIERAEANWARLDSERPACRIAQTLLVADGRLRSTDAKVDVAQSLALLQSRIQANPAAGSLKDLAQHWREGDWHSFFREYRVFRQRFTKSCPTLVAKIVDMVWKRAIHDGDSDILERLTAIGPPPALDPRWNLAWVLGAEEASDVPCRNLEKGWLCYIEDLSTVSCLRDEERSIAVGLVHHRLAKTLLRFAAIVEKPCRYPWESRDPLESNDFREKAARHLRRAVESCPRLTNAYWDLAHLHEEQDESGKSVAVLRRLVGVAPDDFDAHLWLANYHLGRTEPAESEPHVDAALRLRPRDPQCAALRWNQRVAGIRSLAARRKFEEARRQIDEAAQVMRQDDAEPFVIDVMRAAIELKAKNHDASERHLEAALQTAGEPAAVWLAMSAAAAEFRVVRNVVRDFEARLKAALATRPTSRAAGLLAKLLFAQKTSKRNYTGRATQERLALNYLERARRVAWAEADLQMVCQVLELFPKYTHLKVSLVVGGLKEFPANAHFRYWRATDELAKGPRQCDYNLAIEQLRQAIDLARASGDANDRNLIHPAERALSTAYELHQRREPWRESYDYDGDYEDDYEDDHGDCCIDSNSRAELLDLLDDIGDSGSLETVLRQLVNHVPPDVLESIRQIYEAMHPDMAKSR